MAPQLELPQNHALRAGVQILLRGENDQKQWLAPGQGKYPLSHVETFMNRYTSLSKVYRDYDEALLANRDNARKMLLDVGVRECLDARRRYVKLLDWHIEPEDSKSNDQAEFCQLLEKVIRRIKNFSEYRYAMQYAIWFGKYGMMHRWRADVVGNSSVWMPKGIHQDDSGWRPLHGDKIVFRQGRPGMHPGSYEGQMGIRVGWLDHKAGDVINGRWRIEATDYGLAYFLAPAERRSMLVHKHHVEDAAYEDGLRAGSIHGIGIRSVIYWEWVQKQETQAFLMEFMERMAGGVQIWKYPQGNEQAAREMRQAAENYNSGHEHILLVPIPMGEAGNQYGVDAFEPGFQGMEALQHLIKDYFNDRVKRYILGQKLSSEAESTGMGSGVADLHMDTLLQIIKSDATSHEETLTDELVAQIIKINVDKKVWHDPGFRPRLVVETEEADVDKKLEAVLSLMKEGIKFRIKDLYDLVGMAMPGPDDAVNPDAPQPGGQNPGGEPKMPIPGGKGNAIPGEPGGKKAEKDEKDNARDSNTASGGHSSDHVQRYSKKTSKKPFKIAAGWKRKKTS